MRRKLAFALSACVLCGVLSAARPVAAAGDRSFVPHFAPDVTTAWQVNHPDGDDYIAPKSGPKPVSYDPAHPFVPTDPASTTQPTYRIADLSNPILQPWAREEMRKANDDVLAGKIPYVPRERCWPAGVPAFVLEPPFNITIFIETPKEILMIHQEDAQLRHIYMNVSHSKNPKPSWYGESVGHWEGDTLVVDTIGFNERTFVDNYRTPHTMKLHVVERFRLVDGGKTLQDTIRVEDPGAFTVPWTGIQQWKRTNRGPIEEISCAENNAGFYDYDVKPIPQAVKPDF
jgi:hypothetical protein